jgi:ribonuclease VapC
METQFRTKVGPDGRVMIPAALRKELGLAAGEELVVSHDQDGLHLRTRLMALNRARRLVARYIPADADLVAELRIGRRTDALRRRRTLMIFDASALLALLCGEPGSDAADQYLTDAAVSAINLSEVVAVLIRKGMPPEAAQQAVEDLELDVVPFDRDQAYRTARLAATTAAYGLSLGDRACLALAQSRDQPALTTEREWDRVDAGVRVVCVR